MKRGSRKSKKALSSIVASLLVILLVIVAISITWTVVRNSIEKNAEQISLGKVTLDLDIKSVKMDNETSATVNVKRNTGEGEFVAIKFIFYDGTKSEEIEVKIEMQQLELRSFVLILQEINASELVSVKIAPVFELGSGKQVIGDFKDEIKISEETRIPPPQTNCTDTCSGLGYECGSHLVCGVNTDCGTCSTGTCNSSGQCESANCTDTCSSLGYECDFQTVCGISTYCGNCTGGDTCNASGQCESANCTDTCSSLGYECDLQSVCGINTDCGNCTGGDTCNPLGQCITPPPANTSGFIIDHNSAMDFYNIPAYWIEEAKKLPIHYAHTSHGGQIVSGANYVEAYINSTYEFAVREATTEGLPSGNGIKMYDGNPPETYITPGDYWEGTSGMDRTRAVADTLNYNLSMWSWCGEQSSNTETRVNNYLSAMSTFESEYPHMRFILMTGHTDSGSEATTTANNDLVRSYALANDMILFDFAEIEKYYPNGTYVPNADDSCTWCDDWCTANPSECQNLPSCAHSHGALCIQKGKAFWYMMARIAGWDGN